MISHNPLATVIEWVLAGSYDLMNARVSGGTGYLSGTGTGCGFFLGIILRWGNAVCSWADRSHVSRPDRLALSTAVVHKAIGKAR